MGGGYRRGRGAGAPGGSVGGGVQVGQFGVVVGGGVQVGQFGVLGGGAEGGTGSPYLPLPSLSPYHHHKPNPNLCSKFVWPCQPC